LSNQTRRYSLGWQEREPSSVFEPSSKLFTAVFAALILLAWLTLWQWGHSPAGRFQHHAEIGHGGEGGWSLLVLVVAGWSLMTVAMMLLTSLPLVALFHGLTRQRPDRPLLIALLLDGYLGVWTLFGGLVHLGERRLNEAVQTLPWLADRAWVIGAVTLLVAGVYQFTPLKYRCLDRCRSPLSFVMEHWRGRRERLHSLWLGVHHGLFCVGCCWSLMLLMFVVGAGNIGWMLVLGAVMTAEKNLPWGRRLSAPLGLALLYWGAMLVALHLFGLDSLFWLPALGGTGA
jgi:predicted metal-binding membrane protein